MPKIQYDVKGFPLYDPKDGWKDYGQFQAAALNDMDRIASKKQVTQVSPQQQISSALGHAASSALPTIGALGGEALEPVGGGILGAAAGTAVKDYLRHLQPQTFGENPNTTLGQAADSGSDIGLAGLASLAGPAARIAGSVGSKLPLVGKGISSAINELQFLSPTAQNIIKNIIRSGSLVKAQPSGEPSDGNQ